MSDLIDRQTIDFLLFDVFGVGDLCGHGRYDEHDQTSLTAALDLAQKLAEETLWPHAALSDTQEPELSDGNVRILPQAKEALGALAIAGFFSAHADFDAGGMQLPVTINHACNGMMKAANVSTHAYMSLTRAAGNLLKAHGTEAQKRLFLRPMLEGRFFGTMCLSEPDAGSSLADIRTRATPCDDGTYAISGSKMWISGGDHDAAENIVHLVLARLPDAPTGVRGISLFAVPKFLVNDDGSLGGRNGITVAGLNHKMGYRGTSNCLLAFGDPVPAIGTMVGRENEGLKAMFHMMNEARISVGIGGAMLASAGYRFSLNYAKDRRQGRTLSQNDPDSRPVALIRHPDVRRMLLRQKAFSEGGMALCLYAGMLVDRRNLTMDGEERARLDALLDLVTPVVKAWPSEFGLEANHEAIQVLGGYGYSREFPVERLYRDNRLNMIHEGTNGIQALDLLGRKVMKKNSAGVDLLLDEIQETLTAAQTTPELHENCDALKRLLASLTHTIDLIASRVEAEGNDRGLAHASLFLKAFGHVVVGWLWLRVALAAIEAAARTAARSSFTDGKLAACHYFYQHELPIAEAWLSVSHGKTSVVCDIEDESF
jgi:butyryl-CoA dehydrogenase